MARNGLDYKELAKVATELLKENKSIPTLEAITKCPNSRFRKRMGNPPRKTSA